MNGKKLIESLLKDYENGHTAFQIKQFIVGSQAHPFHRYKQCLREIAGRHETIKSNRIKLNKIENRIKKVKLRLFFFRKTKRKILTILEIERKSLIAANYDTSRELNNFVSIGLELRRKFGFENLSIKQKELLDADAWREKAKYMLALDLFSMGSPSKQTAEFIYMLPQSIKKELFNELIKMDRQKIINYLIE